VESRFWERRRIVSKKLWIWGVLGVVCLAVFASGASSQPIEARGRVGVVTVYRGQALVTRLIPVELPGGLSEVVVPDLPQHVVPESLFAVAGQGVEVRAVRYRTRAVREEPREAVRQLDAEIEGVQQEIERNKMLQQVASHAMEYLDKLEQFVAPTAQTELTKGVLDAQTLKDLTLFVLEEHASRSDALLQLRLSERKLKEQLALLQRKRAELTSGSTRTVREAVLFLDAQQGGPTEVRLSYLVGNAGWEPSYNLRARTGQDAVRVEYNAAVYQMSGEGWEEVELTLSTASPALMAEGPELAPFWVTLSAKVAGLPVGEKELAQGYMKAASRLRQSAEEQQVARAPAGRDEAVWDMNVAASQLQNIELLARKDAIRMARVGRPAAAEGISVTYRLPGRISLASRSDRQLVRIAQLELDSTFYYVASPVLTGYVYREAQVANESELSLLEGPATVYLDGQFVGKSAMPMAARGQKFTMGFGMDPQLRAAREMLDRTEQAMGANREITFKYRLCLENYKDEPVEVRLFDRLPHPTEGTDIRVTPGEMTHKLSDDALYVQREKPKGILRWDVTVPARASGESALAVEYAYKLEFDRKLNVTTPLTVEAREGDRLREEFQELQKRRRLAK